MTDDSSILRGMSQIINPQNVKDNINYEEIEKNMVERGVVKNTTAPSERLDKELNEIAKQLNIKLGNSPMERTPKSPMEYRSTPKSPRSPSERFLRSPMENNQSFTDDQDDESDEDNLPPKRVSGMYETSEEMHKKTKEQERYDQIDKVINNIGRSVPIVDIEQEKKEDSKINMLEEIDSIKLSLEEDYVDLKSIPNVDKYSKYEDVEAVLKLLRIKNDRLRYCSLAEEFIILGAHGLEDIFDGQKTYFGKYRPDLSGWNKNVQVKLRRMRHDTSTLVSTVMQDYNIGPLPRILLELIPNMFMYAKRKKSQFGEQKIQDDDDINDTINKIRDHDDMRSF